ncbi:TonB family protein [Aliishimia ponticola]|uniref:TonB family protein n=1 Tax=Aliishimia ponticola TaxID=2499833 RepID=A0A4S4N7L5_9RHOB|nr:energy transducer TonB [Aliishimia ponticola]THH35152.1 TonB family protein [Aliishimia ponticola]
MIKSSATGKTLSLGLAASLIVGATHLAWAPEATELAGGGSPAELRSGTAFEDMAAGILTPEAPQDVLTPATPAAQTAPTMPVQQAEPAPRPVAEPLSPQPAAPAAQAPQAATPAPVHPAAALPAPSVAAALPPRAAETAQQITPADVIADSTPDETAPRSSLRPQKRDADKAAAVVAARPKLAKVRKTPAPPPAPKRGNAAKDNAKGSVSGTRAEAKATTAGPRKTAARDSGNAAKSNYPGKVMRKIQRVRRPSVRAKGSAVVSFRIAANGGLAAASVARSSGSAALDTAALSVVRKAAPFPQPPAGAQRSFSVTIKGR